MLESSEVKMCTSLSIKINNGHCFFGRNMDIPYQFNQSVMIIPKNYVLTNKITNEKQKTGHSMIGMGTVIDGHPVLADGMNEAGLACAGLNFEGYASFDKEPIESKENVTPYDFIWWILSHFKTTEEVKAGVQNLQFVDCPINENTPVPLLHWMVSDKTGKSIVIEKTKEKLSVYDNPVGVMANNPTFDWQLTNLNQYLVVSPHSPTQTNWANHSLNALGVGAGMLGLPGDFGSVSRFVRIAYMANHLPKIDTDKEGITQFFHILDYVKMVKGGALTKEGLEDLTIYSSCMDLQKGIYYYKTYDNSRITAVNMFNETLDENKVILFDYITDQDILEQN